MSSTTPLLSYSVLTDPFPLQASAAATPPSVATLSVVAANRSGGDVALQGIAVSFVVGTGADALTADPSGIGAIPPDGWNVEVQGGVTCTFVPKASSATLPAGESLTFFFNGVQVNTSAGTTPVTVVEGSGRCSPPSCPTSTLPLTKFPGGWGTVSFWATSAHLVAGAGTTLRWSGPQGATYTIEYFTPQTGVVTVPAQGNPPFASEGQYPTAGSPPLVLEQTTTFELSVAAVVGGVIHEAHQQFTVTVEARAPVVTLFTGQVSAVHGQTVLWLSWATENAGSCEITGIPQVLTANGTIQAPAPLLPEYVLTARGDAHAATTARYEPPLTARLSGTLQVDGTRVDLRLTWAAPFAERCDISNVPGPLPPSGTRLLALTAKSPLHTTYTLTATRGMQTAAAQARIQWGAESLLGDMGRTPSAVAFTPDGTRVFVRVTDAVAILDGATFAPAAPLAMAGAASIALSPDGSRLFVSRTTGQLSVLDAVTLAEVPGSPVRFGSTRLGEVAVAPDGAAAFVISYNPGKLWRVDAGKLATIAGAAMDGISHVAVSTDGRRVFVTQFSPGTVFTLDALTLALVADTSVPAPTAIAATPDGRYVLVASSQDKQVYRLDAQTLGIAGDPLPTGSPPRAIAFTPDGALAFVTGQDTGRAPSGTSIVVDLAAWKTANPSLTAAAAAAVAPDGARVLLVWSAPFREEGSAAVLVPMGVAGGSAAG